LLAVGGVSAQQDESCIYSKVEYNEAGRDLSGVELLVSLKGRIKRATQDSSGWWYRSNRVVWFAGKDKNGLRQEATGGARSNSRAVRDDPMAGVLRRKKAEKIEIVRQKKTAKPHG
jgi:hypothetical protein